MFMSERSSLLNQPRRRLREPECNEVYSLIALPAFHLPPLFISLPLLLLPNQFLRFSFLIAVISVGIDLPLTFL